VTGDEEAEELVPHGLGAVWCCAIFFLRHDHFPVDDQVQHRLNMAVIGVVLQHFPMRRQDGSEKSSSLVF